MKGERAGMSCPKTCLPPTWPSQLQQELYPEDLLRGSQQGGPGAAHPMTFLSLHHEGQGRFPLCCPMPGSPQMPGPCAHLTAAVPCRQQPVVSVGPVWAGTCGEVALVPLAAGALPQVMSGMGHLCVTHTTAPVAPVVPCDTGRQLE